MSVYFLQTVVKQCLLCFANTPLENPNLIRWSVVFKAFSGLLALICGNGYIVGINQIYDVGIDKVNKPYLPIAAGDLSEKSAWFLVLFLAATGVLIVGLNFGPFITSLYCASDSISFAISKSSAISSLVGYSVPLTPSRAMVIDGTAI